MQANGLRASNAPGAHRATLDYLVSEMSTLVPEDGVALFEAMRDVRHQIEYPSAGVASVRRTDVDRALALAGKLHGSVRDWWKEKQQAAP